MARTLDVVRHTFGFSGLRPLQDEAIAAVLEARDALVVLPTGGGKSLCYQAPALVRPGLTVVVSPLISLMQDQIDALRACGVAAGMLNSGQDSSERQEIERDLAQGRLKLLYLAPERLMQDGMVARLSSQELAGIAIDEAHCISHWGHDFRPEYRMLGELRRSRPDLAIQAYTATATPRVQGDIIAALGLRDACVVVGCFDRPNLTYRAVPRRDLFAQVMSVIERHPGQAGIVYCLRRTDVEKVCAEIQQRGVRAAPYHAGMDASDRRRTQSRFQREEIDVVVATVAFGMGIDRSDVRFVVHASLPKGVEQYSQETGRAGRDGLPAECVLFYGGADFHGWKRLIERSAREALEAGVETALGDLEHALERIGHVWHFATAATCRHRALCEYFGQRFGELACGACDVCLGEIQSIPESAVVAQKILSCVVRCEQRYGAVHVTDVLRGSDTARVRQTGHDRLSTYGLLADHSARAVRGWIEELVGLGHLRVSSGEYPTLFLSKTGVEVMRGEREVRLHEPVVTAAKKSPARTTAQAAALEEGGPDADEALFERLRAFRRTLARERGVPPYVIFNDRTLALMSAVKPRTREGLRAIKGVGDKKADDLGPLFLAEIARHIDGTEHATETTLPLAERSADRDDANAAAT
jgi:ATP-dependent DNA helicase RecQ